MKITTTLLLLSLLFFSCNKEINSKDLNKINGYWEIKTVVLKNGEKKDYKISETIDYFELQKAKTAQVNIGYRQKVMPQFDGTFKTNNLKEAISISSDNGKYFINYII